MTTHTETATQLGQAMMGILTDKLSAEAAQDFAASLTVATLPGTAARVKQDKAWDTLTRRLVAASGAGE